jgi:hypothetical protein
MSVSIENSISSKFFLDIFLCSYYCKNLVAQNNENLKKLFSIEENFTIPGTNNETGTGLGLILCKEFIEKTWGYD